MHILRKRKNRNIRKIDNLSTTSTVCKRTFLVNWPVLLKIVYQEVLRNTKHYNLFASLCLFLLFLQDKKIVTYIFCVWVVTFWSDDKQPTKPRTLRPYLCRWWWSTDWCDSILYSVHYCYSTAKPQKITSFLHSRLIHRDYNIITMLYIFMIWVFVYMIMMSI